MTCKQLVAAAVLFLAALLLAPAPAPAQTTTTGDVSGVVTDPSNAVVPGASVTLKDIGRGATQTATTGQDGVYRFYLLEPGNYSITVTSTGFRTETRNIEVRVGQVAPASMQLSLGNASQTVTVTEQTPLIQVDSGNLSSTIGEQQAQNIPNPGNDLTYMAQIAPGSVMNTGGGGLGNFSSYGISAVANLFTINGMDDNDPFLNVNNSGATNLTLGQNEVQEVAVVTNAYSGQFGGLAGANINYVTRGGTNQFHGRASYYWNGSAMNANSWFNNATGTPRSFVNANQYGADVGGPIVKDKLFFYFNAEGLYLVIPTSTEAVVPSANFESAAQTNINTLYGSGSAASNFYQTIFGLYNTAPGVSRAANTIPQGDCDQSVLTSTNPILAGFGAGNPCGLAFFSNISNKTHENLQAGRIDWNATDKDRLFVRIQKDLGLQATVTDPINSLFNVQSNQPEWQGQAQETHAFSGGAVNQLVVSGEWYSAIFGVADPAATNAAFPTTLLFDSGQFSDVGGIDFNFPQGRRVTQFGVSDDFSITHGDHTFKTGVKFRRNWVSNTDYSIFSTGLLVPITEASFFTGGADGNSLAEQAFPTSLEQPFAVYSLAGYFEDDWKIRSNLTVTLALRLEHNSNPICFNDCFSRPITEFPNLSVDPTTPYNQLLLVGAHRMLPNLTAIEPEPRLGFAWQPHMWGLQNTVVRGGVGIFYDAFPGALLDGFSENPPFDPTFTVFSSPTSIISSPSDPASLLSTAAASNAAFQSGFSTGGSFSSISAAVPGFSPPSLAASQTNPKVPQYQKWSLEIDRQFGADTSVSLQYVGNHGIHIYTQNSGINGCNVTGTFVDLPPCNPTSGAGINPSFLGVDYAESIGVSNYNGLTASFTHRLRSGIVQVNYSYSHALDTVSNSGIPSDAFSNVGFGATNTSIVFPENPANQREYNYGSADYDARHTLNGNYVWELPIKRYVTRGHGPDALLRGWDVNGAVFFRTGFPYTLIDSGTSSALTAGGYGSSSSAVAVFATQVASGGTGVNCASITTAQPNRGICLNAADFSPSPDGFGNITRNTFRGPNYWNSDFSLMKHTKIYEHAEFVFGAQFFNVFNHPNFDAPVNDIASTRFGQIVKTVSPPTTIFGSVLGADASPRLIQLKAQFNF
ncbi:MAG: carboxypeptidase regulatory-like domain-containing protein [Candidatus Acidiferrales bacterium]